MPLVVGVLATVVASGCINVGKALQKKGIQTLPRLGSSFDLKVLREYAQHRTWATGILLDLGGGLLSIVALSHAPVSVVQPISSGGLSVLAVFSHVYLDERLSRREWAAVGLAVAGTVGVAATAPPATSDTTDAMFSFPGLLVLLCILCLAASAMRGALRRAKATGRRASQGAGQPSAAPRLEELSFGAVAGAAYALSASSCRAGLLAYSYAQPAALQSPALIAGLMASGGLTAAGVVAQTRGLKDGSAMVISTVAAVVSMVVGLLAGILCLGEHAPSTARGVLAWACSWTAIAAGVSGLSHSGGGGEKNGAHGVASERALSDGASSSSAVPAGPGLKKGLVGALAPGGAALWGTFTRGGSGHTPSAGSHLLPLWAAPAKDPAEAL
jgi:drug/metabolite transporter (DMT)-like permease